MLVLHGGGRSPFVRRVEIWLVLQGRPFERRPADIFGEGYAAFTTINPLGRVPALTIAPGEHLIETSAIIDFLEDTAPAALRLLPPTGESRRRCLSRIAHANAIAEKGVALVYEIERRPAKLQWQEWRQRLVAQLDGGLTALEAMTPASGWLGGIRPDGSDVAAVCAYDFIGTIADYVPSRATPKLSALSARAGALTAFSSTHPPRSV